MFTRIFFIALWVLVIAAGIYNVMSMVYDEPKEVKSGYVNHGGGWDMYEAQAAVMCKRHCTSLGLEVKQKELKGTVFQCECGEAIDTQTTP